MAALILNSAGLPEPSPDIKRRLQQVHPGLSLRYQPNVIKDSWMVTMTWEEQDPRRAEVRSGAVDGNLAWDVIGYLPTACGVDEAPAYLTRMLRTAPQENIQRLTDRMNRYNSQVAQGAVETALDDIFTGSNPAEVHTTKVTGRRTKHPLKKG